MSQPSEKALKAARAEALSMARAILVSPSLAASLDAFAAKVPPGIPPGLALGAILERANRGEIPHPSILHLSGRGGWAFWILRGPDGGGLRAHDATIARWDRVQRAICGEFAALAHDATIARLDRVLRAICTRVPGSLNPKAAARSSWRPNLDGNGNFRTYTLDELVKGFRAREIQDEAPEAQT